MSNVYFITHPNVIVDPSVPVIEWSLSDLGVQRMHSMLKLDWVKSIKHIYCSTEKKAIDGAEILGEHLQLSFEKIEELGENDRSSTGYLPAAEFESVADQFFASPSHSIRGWETAAEAQNRIVKTVKGITQSETESGSIAIVSHGAVGTLFLCHINNWSISRDRDQPGDGGGNYFSFSRNTFVVKHGWVAIDTASA